MSRRKILPAAAGTYAEDETGELRPVVGWTIDADGPSVVATPVFGWAGGDAGAVTTTPLVAGPGYFVLGLCDVFSKGELPTMWREPIVTWLVSTHYTNGAVYHSVQGLTADSVTTDGLAVLCPDYRVFTPGDTFYDSKEEWFEAAVVAADPSIEFFGKREPWKVREWRAAGSSVGKVEPEAVAPGPAPVVRVCTQPDGCSEYGGPCPSCDTKPATMVPGPAPVVGLAMMARAKVHGPGYLSEAARDDAYGHRGRAEDCDHNSEGA